MCVCLCLHVRFFLSLFLQLPSHLHFTLSSALGSLKIFRGRLHYWLWKLCNEFWAIRINSVKYCAHAQFASRLNFFLFVDSTYGYVFFARHSCWFCCCGVVLLNETLYTTSFERQLMSSRNPNCLMDVKRYWHYLDR